jgi:hypothetical protein
MSISPHNCHCWCPPLYCRTFRIGHAVSSSTTSQKTEPTSWCSIMYRRTGDRGPG